MISILFSEVVVGNFKEKCPMLILHAAIVVLIKVSRDFSYSVDNVPHVQQ